MAKKADRAGFEPAVELTPYAGLANRYLQPLGHLSKVLRELEKERSLAQRGEGANTTGRQGRLPAMLTLLLALMTTPAEGPMLGDLTPTSVQIWFRDDEPGTSQIDVYNAQGTRVQRAEAVTTAATDNATAVELTSLTPGTRYSYVIDGAHKAHWTFQTPAVDAPQVRIAFGSCAREAAGSGTVWNRIVPL